MSSRRSSQTSVELQHSHANTASQEALGKKYVPQHLPWSLDRQYLPHGGGEKSLLDACSNGDIRKLDNLLRAASDQDLLDPDSYPMLGYSLFAGAIESRRCDTIRLLLQAYPRVSMANGGLLWLAFANPDLELFKLLHARSPGIIHMGFNDLCMPTAFFEACACPDPAIPNYFLDHGITRYNIDEGGIGHIYPLCRAIEMGQPLWLIQRMIELGAKISCLVISAAIGRRDPGILGYIIDQQPGEGWDSSDVERARKTGNDTIIAMVEAAAKEWRSRHAVRTETRTMSNPKRDRKHWWQFAK